MKKLMPSTQSGQALVLIALAAIGLFAFAALAIDGSAIFSDRRHAQNAADTGVLQAALTKVRNPTGGLWETQGLARVASNGYNDNGITNDVLFYNPPISGPYQGNDEYIQVKIRSDVKLFFARIIGRQKATNNVEAVARATPTDYDEMFSGNAVVGLAPHDCHAVVYQGNADTTITGGGIFVMSDCPDAAFFNHSGAAELHAPSLCAVGGIEYRPGALSVPSISEGCSPPPQIIEPNPACIGNAVKTGNTLSPGNWTGHFPPAGVDTLQSGVYCVNGDFRLNGGDSLTGHGVVIRMNSGDVSWNGGATVHLEAPTEGDFNGLLLYMPSSTNCSTIKLNGNSGSTLVGTVLAPCADVTIEGTGDSGIDGQIIGYTVALTGTSSNSIHYNDAQNYDALIPPTLEMTQ
jgi:putative adhesin/putative Flp pilus-assembly TadE/G-like protein